MYVNVGSPDGLVHIRTLGVVHDSEMSDLPTDLGDVHTDIYIHSNMPSLYLTQSTDLCVQSAVDFKQL